MEDFVSFNLALKLKEKGFKEECFAYYHTDGELIYNTDHYRGGIYKDCLRSYNSLPPNPIGVQQVDAPTISQVLKWLREEKDVDLVIEPIFLYDDILGKMREYNCRVFATTLNKPECCGYYETWEESALNGIEYVLDNLI